VKVETDRTPMCFFNSFSKFLFFYFILFYFYFYINTFSCIWTKNHRVGGSQGYLQNGILFLLVFGLSYQGKAIIVFRFITKNITVALRDFGP
jgi:hypothetical protein